jgi:putative aldouronate transport system permease protein
MVKMSGMREGTADPIILGGLPRKKSQLSKHMKVWQLYACISIPLALVIVFSYVPMGGVLIAFKDFSARRGIFGSPWVGMKYFNQFFETPIFWTLLKNTVLLSLYSLVAGFPFSIILALAFNEMTNGRLKKSLQTITYAPFFISTVVMVGIILQLLSIRYGAVNILIKALGGAPIDFIGQGSLFRSIYVWSGIWQGAGYGSVLYVAALAAVDPSLYEAAVIDGASRFQKVIHIDIPSILPTIIITLILSTGGILSVGFEKVYLLQNPLNYKYSEIISTYVYKVGIQQAQFSLSTAVGVFNSVVNFIILLFVNYLARKQGETSLF